MAEANLNKDYNTFSGGIITEASPLAMAENSVLDASDLLFNKDGSVQVRQGMDYEAGYALSSNITTADLGGYAVNEIEWKSAANNGLYNFLVIQIGPTLYIHDMSNATIGASIDSIDITPFSTGYAVNIGSNPVQGVVGNGYLICTSKDTDPFYIKYDSTTDQFTATEFTLSVRDFKGLDDGVAVDTSVDASLLNWTSTTVKYGNSTMSLGDTITGGTSGATATIAHVLVLSTSLSGITTVITGKFAITNVVGTFVSGETITSNQGDTATLTSVAYAGYSDERTYNLYNQGWSATHIASYLAATGSNPDNTMIWTAGKDSSDNFSPTLLDKQYFGNTPAPKGHYILDVFNRDRATASGLTSLEVGLDDVEQNRPEAVAFFAGRAFFSGIESTPDNITSSEFLNGNIYYSQILTDIDKIGNCYQEADPTAEDINSLVDTDGGVIHIPDVGKVLRIVSIGNYLVVIANNGIWSIRGGDQGFTPSDYFVEKISNTGAIGYSSVVAVEGSILYWSEIGIYILAPNEVTGTLVATNLTETTIDSIYTNITTIAKSHAKGVYDSVSKKIRWVYNSDPDYAGTSFTSQYYSEIVLDVTTGAFYRNAINLTASNSPYIAGVFSTPNIFSSTRNDDVVVNGDQVQAAADDVYVVEDIAGEANTSIKYLAVVPQSDGTNSKYTFSRYLDPTFTDWVTSDSVGKAYSGWLIVGYDTLGDNSRSKQSGYITAHFQQTETQWVDDGSGNAIYNDPSSVFMQSRWEWSNHSDSGKWGSPVQIYRFRRAYTPSGASLPETFNSGYMLVTTKNRIRGSGRALSLYIYAETGKNMHLLGLSGMYEGRSAV